MGGLAETPANKKQNKGQKSVLSNVTRRVTGKIGLPNRKFMQIITFVVD
jgi:hypothetical protein